MKSVFIHKAIKPTSEDLKKALGDTFELWMALSDFTQTSKPGSFEEWTYSSEKYGWSFRIRDKKRVLIYLLPRDKFFKVAFVFGQNATDEILHTKISQTIIQELNTAKVYAEGRGIRIDVKEKSIMNDIKELIRIKIKH